MLEQTYEITFINYEIQTCFTPLLTIDNINTVCEYLII